MYSYSAILTRMGLNIDCFVLMNNLSTVLLENGAALSNSTTGVPVVSNSTDSISTAVSPGSSDTSPTHIMTMMASTTDPHPFESLSSETRAVVYTIGLLLGLACVVAAFGCSIVGCLLYHRNDSRRRQDR